MRNGTHGFDTLEQKDPFRFRSVRGWIIDIGYSYTIREEAVNYLTRVVDVQDIARDVAWLREQLYDYLERRVFAAAAALALYFFKQQQWERVDELMRYYEPVPDAVFRVAEKAIARYETLEELNRAETWVETLLKTQIKKSRLQTKPENMARFSKMNLGIIWLPDIL